MCSNIRPKLTVGQILAYFSYLSVVFVAAAAAAKSLQSCPTLCDPIDSSPWGSPVPGILQARTLEWGAISFSNAGKWKVRVKLLSRVRLLATPWTAAYQAPPSMGLSRQEYWSGVPLLSPVFAGLPTINQAFHTASFLPFTLPPFTPPSLTSFFLCSFLSKACNSKDGYYYSPWNESSERYLGHIPMGRVRSKMTIRFPG